MTKEEANGGVPSIVNTVKIHPLRWAGHDVRMLDDSLVEMILGYRAQEKEARTEQGGLIN